jgi:hypothetical protein
MAITMQTNTMTRFSVAALSLLMASSCAHAEPLVRSGSILLSDLAASSDINNVAVSPNGMLACVVGSYVKEREATVYSTVTLVDLVQKKVGWTKQMPPPDAMANVYAVACRFQGDNLYALANADAAHAMANNVGRVYVYKYGRNGDELKHAAIPVSSESRVAIDMLADDGKLHVIGLQHVRRGGRRIAGVPDPHVERRQLYAIRRRAGDRKPMVHRRRLLPENRSEE